MDEDAVMSYALTQRDKFISMFLKFASIVFSFAFNFFLIIKCIHMLAIYSRLKSMQRVSNHSLSNLALSSFNYSIPCFFVVDDNCSIQS